MGDWMAELARQLERARKQHPDDELLVLFDIDGTILDERCLMQRLLLGFDRSHGTRHFYGLRPEEIHPGEEPLATLLQDRSIDPETGRAIREWYLQHRRSSAAVLLSDRPFPGVMDVIRWLQIQPRTHVGINTGRPESLRETTLHCLNILAREQRVEFRNQLLHMRPDDEEDIGRAKADGLRQFAELGFRILAAVDDDPDSIEAMAAADPGGDILFLHAETLVRSTSPALGRCVSGTDYDITALITESRLPRHVELVWHGVNDRHNLRQFLASPIQWGECDVRMDPLNQVVARHDSFVDSPWSRDEECLTLEACLGEFRRLDKSVKLDLKEANPVVDRVLELLAQQGFDDSRLWFHADIETVGEAGFRQLERAHPRSVRQCSVDFLTPLILTVPDRARNLLEMLCSWGVNRFLLNWKIPARRRVFERLEQWGYQVNLYNVPDLESFLQAALLLPSCLTVDFNFPQWNYFGRGSGENGVYHRYGLEPVADGEVRDPTAPDATHASAG
jgi:beta-phosphoglucomutase-like phosphatase (HAD superfamily)